jgi:hypothetical protein
MLVGSRVYARALLTLLLTLSSASALAGDDTFRCGSKLIDSTASREIVLKHCGEPTSKTSEEIPQYGRYPNGNTYVNGTIRVETWTYDRGSSSFPAILRFEDDKLVSIEIVRP